MNILRGAKVIATIENGRLYKGHLVEKKHLLWSHGGVPAIDAFTWEQHKAEIREVLVSTDKRTFKISAAAFDKLKEEVNHPGYGRQYVVRKEHWIIT